MDVELRHAAPELCHFGGSTCLPHFGVRFHFLWLSVDEKSMCSGSVLREEHEELTCSQRTICARMHIEIK